jgi:MFS family permease
MYTTVSIIFFVQSVHVSAGFVGTGLTIAAAFGLIATLQGGRLADRKGAKPVLVVLFVVQAVLFALFPLISGRIEFLVAVICAAISASATLPTQQMFLSDLLGGAPRVAAAAYNRSVVNVGLGLGALLAALALAADSRPAFDAMLLGNALSFAIGAVVLGRLKAPGREKRPSGNTKATVAAPNRHPLRQPGFVAAAFICGVLYLSASVLDVALPLQVSRHTSAPRWIIAALLLLNTILAITLQVRASVGSETIPGAARANRLAGISLLAGCVLFALTTGHNPVIAVVMLVAATVMLTAGELFSSAGTWGMSYGLAPRDQQGKYLASFSLVSRTVRIAGPALAAIVVNDGDAWWIAAGLVFFVAGLAAPVVARRQNEPKGMGIAD